MNIFFLDKTHKMYYQVNIIEIVRWPTPLKRVEGGLRDAFRSELQHRFAKDEITVFTHPAQPDEVRYSMHHNTSMVSVEARSRGSDGKAGKQRDAAGMPDGKDVQVCFDGAPFGYNTASRAHTHIHVGEIYMLAMRALRRGEPEAEALLRFAAASGDVCAMLQLGRLYLHGNATVVINRNKGLEWLERAEQGGCHMALREAGEVLRKV